MNSYRKYKLVHADYAAESPFPCWPLEPRPSALIN